MHLADIVNQLYALWLLEDLKQLKTHM